MAREWTRGEEHAASQASCEMISQTVREEQPFLRMVPQRFLCQNVRHYVRERYLEAGFTAGPPLLIFHNEVVGAKHYDEAMASIGLVETENGLSQPSVF